MTLTTKPIEVTLSPAEQDELLHFLKNPWSLQPVPNEPLSERKRLVESLVNKGYLRVASVQCGYTFYALK